MTDKDERKLRLILPKGSLNTPGRGNTCEFLKDAGYDIVGYEPKNESRDIVIRNDPEIEVELARPQTALLEMKLGAADAAILGTDWAIEGRLPYDDTWIIPIEENLGYGKVMIVAASKKFSSLQEAVNSKKDYAESTNYVNIWSEYLGITKRWLTDRAQPSCIFARGITSGDPSAKVRVWMSDGETERFTIKKGKNDAYLADIIIDCTQTGRALESFGLKIIDRLMISEAGLYATDEVMLDDFKRAKIEEIAAQLLGVKRARDNYMVVFNVPAEKLEGTVAYLIGEKLCGKEPTVINAGKEYAQIQTQMPRARWIEAARTLQNKYKASDMQRYEPKQIIR